MNFERERLFDSSNEQSNQYLLGVLDGMIEQNATDAQIILRLQKIYAPSCWFSVISAAEKIIYR